MGFWRWRIWRNWHHNCCLIFERGAVVGEDMDIVTNHELLVFGVLGMKEWRGEIRQMILKCTRWGITQIDHEIQRCCLIKNCHTYKALAGSSENILLDFSDEESSHEAQDTWWSTNDCLSSGTIHLATKGISLISDMFST